MSEMNETCTVTQKQAVLSYLQTGERLTGLQALEMFGCIRLSARIKELKDSGHNIKSEKIKVSNGKRVASYRLVRA